MTVARVTEISAESPLSFEDAICHGIDRATRSLRNVKGAWVKEQRIVVDDDKITKYRADILVTFMLDEDDEDHGDD